MFIQVIKIRVCRSKRGEKVGGGGGGGGAGIQYA
jgi:hypothetical protein